MQAALLLLIAFVASASAFGGKMPKRAFSTQLKAAQQPGPSYWEGAVPPSAVLGVGKSIPSAVFGPLSLVALAVGTLCVHESNIFHSLSAESVNPQFILGSLLVPISWGMHVASWIQKGNGK